MAAEDTEKELHCPECGDERVAGDGNSWECDWCGFTFSTVGGRGAKNYGEVLEDGR